ncbi:MAG: HXXEE domain-containing protein [Prevotella sp.]
MMSALAILYMVIPLPLAFVIHDAEEIIMQHRWMIKHRKMLERRFPRLKLLIEHLSQLDTKSFAIAALEELVVLLCVTAYVFVHGIYATEIWIALFMAFSLHLLIHIVQAIVVKGYVPGLVTSVVLLPYITYGIWSIGLIMDVITVFVLSVTGLLLVAANLYFSHWLGVKFCKHIE